MSIAEQYGGVFNTLRSNISPVEYIPLETISLTEVWGNLHLLPELDYFHPSRFGYRHLLVVKYVVCACNVTDIGYHSLIIYVNLTPNIIWN